MADTSKLFAAALSRQRGALGPFLTRYVAPMPPRRVTDTGSTARPGIGAELALLRDLQRLHRLTADCKTTIDIVSAAAAALRDQHLASILSDMHAGIARQLSWLDTQLRQASAQALTVPQ